MSNELMDALLLDINDFMLLLACQSSVSFGAAIQKAHGHPNSNIIGP